MLAMIECEPYEQHKQTTPEFSIRWAAPPRLHLKPSKQWVNELQHPNFADLEFAQIISERFTIPIARATIN
jgi:hypothetical protein